MKSLVIYSSQMNNTKKLTEAVGDVLSCDISAIADAEDLSGIDLVAVGL